MLGHLQVFKLACKIRAKVNILSRKKEKFGIWSQKEEATAHIVLFGYLREPQDDIGTPYVMKHCCFFPLLKLVNTDMKIN